MSADVEPLTDERLTELWEQVQQDRRDGYPTMLAEQLIREVQRLREVAASAYAAGYSAGYSECMRDWQTSR